MKSAASYLYFRLIFITGTSCELGKLPSSIFARLQGMDKVSSISPSHRRRDHAFPLLLQKNAGEFPIVYASRIGKSHQGQYAEPDFNY